MSNHDYLISIIVPCYNTGQFINECLSSIMSQSYRNWECIVVDDNSSDDTFKKVEFFVKWDNRFRLISRPKIFSAGANTCRNYGAKYANGEFIKWFDSDDIMCKNHLKIVVSHLSNSSLDFVVSKSQNFDNRTINLGLPYKYDEKIELNTYNIARNLTGWITNDLTIKKHVLLKLNFNDSSPEIQEYNFNVRLVSMGFKGGIINDILSLRRVRKNSITQIKNSSDKRLIRALCIDKLFTSMDLNSEIYLDVIKWYLAGYMRLSFELIIKKHPPPYLIQGLVSICKHFGFIRSLYYATGMVCGYLFGRGYNIVKIARKL